MSNLKDNRIIILKGEISSLNDLDEVFRELCSNFSESIMKIKAEAKVGNKAIGIVELLRVCRYFDLEIHVDFALDYFKVWHHKKGESPVVSPTNEEIAERFEEVKSSEEPNDEEGIF